ncbi:MAG: hypothetical protein KDB90_09855 [Planctomycetes bacterium]|nr:hypothetical protein [Planctomycetota bacterium]
MKTSCLIALLFCACLVCACSDDKPSSDSSGSKCSGKSDDKPARDVDKPDPPDRRDGDENDWPREDDKPEGEHPVRPDNDEPADTPGAERGFKASNQAESDSLDGKEFNSGATYNGGDKLKITQLGFSFAVPSGSICGMPVGSSAIQLRDEGKDMLALLFARTGVTEAEARDMIGNEFDLGAGTDASKMIPVGQISKDGDHLLRRFESTTLVGYAEVLLGKNATVGILTVGVSADADFLKSYRAKVIGGVKFATPGGEKDRVKYQNDLKGKVVKVFKYNSGGGGYGGTSWSSETNMHWHLGSDGHYLYYYQHTGSSSFDSPDATGGHAADTNNNHEGTWSLELTLTGSVLVLRDSKGVIHTQVLGLKDGRLYVDGDEATVGPSDKVR